MTPEQGFLDDAVRDAQSVTADWMPVDRLPIDGVRVVEIRSVPKRAGFLTEVFRGDWPDAGVVSHVFQVTLAPGAVSAWHAHRDTTDRIFVAAGSITLVLYDGRAGSRTRARLAELQMTIARPQLVVIPPGVWHGLIVTGATPAVVLNLTDLPYAYDAPDHWRLPHDTPAIPYRFGASRDALD
jgi:dTDP-4-dehydrorhamnose 3,5-epimerase